MDWFQQMNSWVILKFVNSLRPSGTYVLVNWVIIGSGNGLLPERIQAITWTNADWLWIVSLGINFIEIWIKIHLFFSGKCI